MRLAAHGLAIDLPDGWEGRITRRAGARPLLHAATFPLRDDDGDFATGAVERLPGTGALLVLAEYEPDLAGRGLFAGGRPRLDLADARPNALLRRVPGQAGLQRFFTESGRPFCLYAVVGTAALARRPAVPLATVVDSLAVDPAGA